MNSFLCCVCVCVNATWKSFWVPRCRHCCLAYANELVTATFNITTLGRANIFPFATFMPLFLFAIALIVIASVCLCLCVCGCVLLLLFALIYLIFYSFSSLIVTTGTSLKSYRRRFFFQSFCLNSFKSLLVVSQLKFTTIFTWDWPISLYVLVNSKW